MTTRFHALNVACLAALALAAGVPVADATAAPATAATTAYTVTDLGSLGGGYSDAAAINATGQVTGYSTTDKLQVACWPGAQTKKCFEPIAVGAAQGAQVGHRAVAVQERQIVANAFDTATNQLTAILLTPN